MQCCCCTMLPVGSMLGFRIGSRLSTRASAGVRTLFLQAWKENRSGHPGQHRLHSKFLGGVPSARVPYAVITARIDPDHHRTAAGTVRAHLDDPSAEFVVDTDLQRPSSSPDWSSSSSSAAASSSTSMPSEQQHASQNGSDANYANVCRAGINGAAGAESIPFGEEDEQHPSWDDGQVWASPLTYSKRIFCNRSLNMRSIRSIGFDMDYTLAQYKSETFETLAYQLTVQKLVTLFGYPEEILDWKFDWTYMVRGLAIDKRRGNILKMDRHKYVKIAYHGFKELPRDVRISTYGHTPVRDSFDEPAYALIDTLFSLPEAYLFAQLVELMDAKPGLIPEGKEYEDLYRDVRAAVDHCHRDGSLKRAVAEDPAKYIHKDETLVPLLKMLRRSGRRVFIVTNSLWDYTFLVMNFLCGKDGITVARDDSWLELFDVVIVGSCKPTFFMDGPRPQLFEVHTPTGMLMNTDNGTPLAQVGDIAPPPAPMEVKDGVLKAKVFQGGNFRHLHAMLQVPAGSQLLYVGDHIYGDILRSKKTLGWRTMLIVPELEKELRKVMEISRLPSQDFKLLRDRHDSLDDHIQRLEWKLKFGELADADRKETTHQIANLREQRDAVKSERKTLEREYHAQFHPVWGQLMKTGNQNSRFAHQVERFACLYTSSVSNLRFYSPENSYHSPEDLLPHETCMCPSCQRPVAL
eukprot:jgi/Chlat1/3321/Chrsp22S03415